ncbi:MAG: site-specific DNA-methyltransferase [Melioribacteraceae bacterium]|nr:site-specific DNA-methyltransferase [Melioribacteraceae bacterium]
MEKLKMQTPILVDKNVEQIGKIFPEVITEIKDKDGNLVKGIDFDLLKQKLSDVLVEDENERYRLDWPGKKASLLKANTPINKTLRPVVEDSVDFENTENLYIEGDNFEVLKILQESYLGKVKMIYIDPPYNTGNDFIYKDDYKKSSDEYEEELGLYNEEGGRLFKNTDSNGRFHSDWLSMMYERISVSRDVLSDDGVIFISIDDNEFQNIRRIGDEIFGEQNFIDTLKWKRKKQPSFLATHTAKVMEYIVIYSKKKEELEKLSIDGTSDFTKKVINVSNKESERVFKEGVRIKIEGEGIIPKGRYKIRTMDVEYLDDLNYKNGKVLNNVRVVSKFSVSQDKIEEYIENGLLFITAQKGLRRDVAEEEIGKRKSITDLLLSEWGDNQESENELIEIFGTANYFEYTKPIDLIKNLTKSNFTENNIVLDFFSGSATTAHAVMQLNAEDGGKRKFIMVQLPEETEESSEAYKAGYKTIAEIGKERIRRAGKKIKEEFLDKYTKELEKINKELEQESLEGNDELNEQKAELEAKIEHIKKLDTGFRVYKTDSSNMKDIFYHPSELKQQQLSAFESNIKEDRTPEDLLTQVILDLGLELSLKIEKKEILGNNVFVVQENALVACFDDNIDFGIVDKIAELKPFKVVFKDASFADDKDRINVEERFKRLSPETVITVL